jgi:hypothetical protein
MNQDLDLFNDLIKDEVPDCELDETLFAYYSTPFQTIITKISEVNTGFEIKSIYKVVISGSLNTKRFVKNKENALLKAYFLVNDYFEAKAQAIEEEIYEESFTGSRYTAASIEDLASFR